MAKFPADAQPGDAGVAIFNATKFMKRHFIFLFSALLACLSHAVDPAPVTATELAGALSARQQDGNSFVKLRMEIQPMAGNAKTVLQLQIKQRRTAAATEIVYQVLWPKERFGEAILLRKVGNQPAVGTLLGSAGALSPLTAAQMTLPWLGGDLTYADALEDFFTWEGQRLAGNEVIDRVNCQILESKPGKGQSSNYASVRTWVDLRRLVPLRVEKYLPSGKLARRIDTTRVVKDDLQRYLPANLAVSGVRSEALTELTGSKLKHGVVYADEEFTAEGLKLLTAPRTAEE